MKSNGNLKNKRQWHGLCNALDYPYFKRWKPLQKETMMKCLLIVDDDPDHRLILRTMFEARGYVCEEAEDGDEALSKLETGQVALVITDLNMPGLSGLELIDQMRKFELLQKTPAILMTSQGMEGRSSEAYNVGAQAIVSKPYNFSKLLKEVGLAIGSPESCELSTAV